jgi:predicted transcriptional regulator
MKAESYVKALAKLGLSPYSAAPHLGISRAMSFRYAAGSHAIPETVAKLVRALVRLGTTEI